MVRIVTPVVVVMVIAVICFFIVVAIWYFKCRVKQQFEFKPMNYSDLKAKSGADDEGEQVSTTEKEAVGNEYETNGSDPPSSDLPRLSDV